jgi:NAD(P)-dependent dehydrogenase (short-subunit alcohol dehydrogenase family)
MESRNKESQRNAHGNQRQIAVAFLASQKASYITGHTLDVNGGMHMG